MNRRSLKLIREVMINSSRWTSIEVSQDSIYLQFRDVELGTPRSDESFSLVVRFAEDSFFTVFYKNIWDIEFLSRYNYKYNLLSEEFAYNVKNVEFTDFKYLNKFFKKLNYIIYKFFISEFYFYYSFFFHHLP